MGKLVIAVVDGLGGGIGSQMVARLRRGLGTEVELIALGANATATERMVRAGADRGASGENAIVFTASKVDVVVGPIGIVIPNSMMGEITVAMANAIVNSPARKLLLPVEQPHLTVVGLEPGRLGERIGQLVELLQQM
jgi:hypothetical protein